MTRTYDTKRITWEKNTFYKMIRLYYKHHNNIEKELKNEYIELYNYSISRINACIFKNKKPVCSKCKIHCFNDEYGEEVRKIMRWSGPRMILYYPKSALIYLYYKYRY